MFLSLLSCFVLAPCLLILCTHEPPVSPVSHFLASLWLLSIQLKIKCALWHDVGEAAWPGTKITAFMEFSSPCLNIYHIKVLTNISSVPFVILFSKLGTNGPAFFLLVLLTADQMNESMLSWCIIDYLSNTCYSSFALRCSPLRW